jgi:hypothetical protein
LSAVRECSFNIFAAASHIRRPFLRPQSEDAPCHFDRAPTYHGQFIRTYCNYNVCSELTQNDVKSVCGPCSSLISNMQVKPGVSISLACLKLPVNNSDMEAVCKWKNSKLKNRQYFCLWMWHKAQWASTQSRAEPVCVLVCMQGYCWYTLTHFWHSS